MNRGGKSVTKAEMSVSNDLIITINIVIDSSSRALFFSFFLFLLFFFSQKQNLNALDYAIHAHYI